MEKLKKEFDTFVRYNLDRSKFIKVSWALNIYIFIRKLKCMSKQYNYICMKKVKKKYFGKFVKYNLDKSKIIKVS